ncbi:MAG: phosphohydrolase [Comamonadaceae bacterium]|nr:phosphohydrolase [Comamonadaceae bacterium]
MSLNLHDIQRLLDERGPQQYGLEAVSQLEHALQCAHLAQVAGESDALVIACLLHDLGHLLAAEKDGTREHDTDRDDLHQYAVLPFLRGILPDAVLEPIRLHVDAKRCLCQIETGYFESLSPASVHSLAQQGGPFTEVQARAFLHLPHAEEAIRLRRYDDLAKVPDCAVPPLDHYLPRLAQLMLQSA